MLTDSVSLQLATGAGGRRRRPQPEYSPRSSIVFQVLFPSFPRCCSRSFVCSRSRVHVWRWATAMASSEGRTLLSHLVDTICKKLAQNEEPWQVSRMITSPTAPPQGSHPVPFCSRLRQRWRQSLGCCSTGLCSCAPQRRPRPLTPLCACSAPSKPRALPAGRARPLLITSTGYGNRSS